MKLLRLNENCHQKRARQQTNSLYVSCVDSSYRSFNKSRSFKL